MITAFKKYLSTLSLGPISRKLYASDLTKFLSFLGTDPSLEQISSPKSYTSYFKYLESHAIAPSMLKRTMVSLRWFGSYVSLTYSLPNPLSELKIDEKSMSNSSSDAVFKYIKHFTKYLAVEHLSPLTIKSYKSDILRYFEWIISHLPGTKFALLLNEKNIEKYLNYLSQSNNVLASTIDRKLKSIRRFKDWFVSSYPESTVSDNKEVEPVTDFSNTFDSNMTESDNEAKRSNQSPQLVPDLMQNSVKKINYRIALSFGILSLFIIALGIFSYRQFSQNVKLTAAFPSSPVTPNRQLSFQGRLEDAGGTPITTATNLTFKLWDDPTTGTQLYTSGVCSLTPDSDGVFSTQIGGTCGSAIASSVFTENANVYLEVTVASETLAPRQQIASVAYALNSETIQGFPISSTVSAIRNTVVPMNQWGEIIVGEQSPRLKGVSGTFQISAPALSFTTSTGTNGNISFAPDGTGQINATGNTTTTNFFNVSNAQLTTGSLITGTAANNNTGFKLLDLLSGSSPTSKFSVSDAGNVTLAGDLTVTGDDIFMTTNTAGMLLIADGSSFGPTTMSGDITINGSGVTTIGADKITESMLKSINGPTDELCLSYESTGGDFEWQACGSGGGGSNWRSNLGALSPLNDTWDLLVGGIATSSAKAGFININSGTPTATVSAGISGGAYLSASGTLATTAKQTLTIGNSTTGNINIGVGAGDLLIGESGTAVDIHFAESGNIEADAGKVITLTDIGNITPDTDSTYSLGASPTSAWLNIYGDNIYQNGNLVCDASGTNCPASGVNYWRSSLGALSPLSDSYDLLLGNTATASAKAGFINIDSGTPTATVSAGAAGGMYISSTGTLATTAKQTLTIGATSTGNVIIAPGGTTALTAIGSALTAAGNLNLTAATNLIFGGTTNLGETTSNTDSGAFLVGVFDEFSNSSNTKVQSVLKDLDTAITTALTGTSIWTDAGTYLYPTASEVLGNSASAGANKLAGIYLSDSSPLVFGLDNDFSLSFNNTTSTLGSTLTTGTRLGIGTTTGLATLDLRSSLGTIPVASISGNTAQATLIVDQSGIGDIFTASSAGNPRFVIQNNGNVGIGNSLPTQRLDVTGNATTSGNITMGGQLQLGRFAATPTAIGSGAMIFNTTTNTNQCYNGTVWYNCGGSLYSNTNASVADGSYITVAHNLANTDLLSGAWINSQGVWKSLDANYKPAIAWEGKDTEKGIYHNEINKYVPTTETGTSTSTLNSGLIFDTFEDSTKTDSANTTSSVALQMGDDGSSNFATLNQRVQTGRTGLVGGQTLATSTTDNDGQTYLGSNTVNDMYYYDRSKDSVPAVLVDLGIDPNWYNGVTLSVATNSATYSPSGTINDKNPNLTTTYNGSLIKVTGTDSTPRTIYITIKSPTTFDWTNYQGDSATGVTITPGIAQTLGSTGVSAIFSSTSYNVGDVFKIASWFIEGESATRGAKQQFPERSNIVATASSVDIIDADTQKLWMRFDSSTDANDLMGNYAPNNVKALNGYLYKGAGSSAGGLYGSSFVSDRGFHYGATNKQDYPGSISMRNDGLGLGAGYGVGIITSYVNDVDAAVIPNQPTKEVTVSGWGYIVGDGTTIIEETVKLPYKFNTAPNVVVSSSGYGLSPDIPTSISDCNNRADSATGQDAFPNLVSNSSFQANYTRTTGTFSATAYYCYTWTATGSVSPKQIVAVATGTSANDGGTTIINETDGAKSDVMVGSQSGDVIYNTKVAIAKDGTLYNISNDSTSPATVMDIYYGIHGITSSETSIALYRSGYYNTSTAGTFSNGGPVILAGTNDSIKSLTVTDKSSTIDPNSNTIYLGTTSGLNVIQEYQGLGSQYDSGLERRGSVKYYTKDYISEEMVGDIRGMWPLNNSNTASDFEDVSIKANTLTGTNITASGDSITGVRSTATDLNGTNEYFTRANDADFDLSTALTLGGWINTSSSSTQTIFQRYGLTSASCVAPGSSGTNAYYSVAVSSGKITVTVRDNTDSTVQTLTGNITVNDGVWHNIEVVIDKTNALLKIYVDGNLDNSATLTETGTYTFDDGLYIGALCDSVNAVSGYFAGYLDELFISATALTQPQIKNMYQFGYRALQSHGTTLGGGSADTNQQLGYISTGTSSVSAVAVDTNNQYMYVGTNSTTLGALSKIELNSDTNIKTYNSSANVPTGGALLLDEDVTSLSVGETLNAAGSAASGIKTMGLDNNATATSGNFVSKSFALPKNIGSAVLWVSGIIDSGDGSNTLTVKASNDNGATYTTCTLVTTDSNPAVPEKEYACTFAAADNDLKVKFEFARGSTKTNTYLVQYGISWLGETGFRIEQADANNVRLYNFSGETQNLKLNVTGASAATLASPWTDAGSYLYPTGYETLRIYDGAGSNYLALSDAYINFGATSGSSGYGIRDNAGTMEFKNLSGAWTAMGTGGGASWWDQTAGTLQPYNKTVDLLLGSTATSSAKIALININSGTPTATISAGTSGGIYVDASGKIATTAKQTLALGDSTTTGNIILQGGNVGIGVASPTQKLEVAGYVVGQRFEDSASSSFFIDPAATGTSISIDGNIVSDGAFNITSNATNGNITINAGSGTVLIGAAGAGKLDAGTIDPPYTINGEKFATYMAGMTGVKEETTGVVLANEQIVGKGYRATLDFAGSLTGSDLWLFSKASNLKNKLDKLVVLLSSSGNGKTWYEIDAQAGKLYLYSQNKSTISYRLTAPRYDDTAWLNTRDDNSTSIGHVINDDNNWSVSQEITNLFSNNQVISPLGEGQSNTIEGSLTIRPATESTTDPLIVVEGELDAATISARVAHLGEISADSITAKNIVADSITANTIVGLEAKIASYSGMTDQQFDTITDRIKQRLASIMTPSSTAEDIPVPPETAQVELEPYNLASPSANTAMIEADFVTINNYLAVIGEATITTLNVTNNLYVDSINSKSGRIALANNLLILDENGQVSINGDLTISGKILADSASLNSLELGSPAATSSSALGKLLSVYNESGVAVATIDASGSANLASLTTNMITIASPSTATDSAELSDLLGFAQSNATAGESVLLSPNTELTINSPYINPHSLVYLTPTANTDNKVLFVKSKNDKSFTVGIDNPASSDISFNWWIIQLDESH